MIRIQTPDGNIQYINPDMLQSIQLCYENNSYSLWIYCIRYTTTLYFKTHEAREKVLNKLLEVE